jgi:aldose 1-epimerase
MELFTNQPAIQFYTAKHLAPMKGKNGLDYGPFTAFCLEDQVHPDAVNHPHFPNTLLRPGETYIHETRYAFSVRA